MANTRSDANGYTAVNSDEERDMGAKGGPTTSLGTPDSNHDIPQPYNDDIQTQLAAKSTANKKENNKPDTFKKNGI